MRYLITALRHPHDYEWAHLRPFQRHSLVLGVAGGVYIAVGLVYILTAPTDGRLSGLRLAVSIAPMDAWGVLWIVVGQLALISARWPPASRTWGYTVLTGLAACWSSMYLLGAFLLGAPGSGISGALVWALVAFLWWAIAGLVNPDDLLPMIEDPAAWAPDTDPTEEPDRG